LLFDCREFGKIIFACVVIFLLLGVVSGLVYLITGTWQNLEISLLVMISALIGEFNVGFSKMGNEEVTFFGINENLNKEFLIH